MKTTRVVLLGLVALAGGPSFVLAQNVFLEPFVAGVDLEYPVGITHAGDGSGRLFFTSQRGYIWVHASGQLLPDPFLNISPLVQFQQFGEEGLLGTAFHPSYETNGLFYVYYTNTSGDNVVARYQVSAANPNVADPTSGAILLTIPHPVNTNHNGGQLAFGPDGYLYVGTGDGGGFGDPAENAQDLGRLLGKILRLDMNGAAPYAIPPGNPFVGVPGARPEIWAYGLRNPWRFSFDRQTGDLFIGDVGQDQREEIDFQPAGIGGRNYGWDDMEGTLCYEPSTGCLTAGRELPILEYDHSAGDCAVIGGFRYRGTQIAGLPGRYLYADNCSGYLRVARESPPGQWSWTQTVVAGFSISALGEDESGELYVARYGSGSIIYHVAGGPPALQLLSNVDVLEGTGGTSLAHVPVTLGPTLQAVSARYETLPTSNALPGDDYVPVSGAVTFAPSHEQQSQEILVPLVPDALPEDIESFQVRLFDVVNAYPADQVGYVHIFDDDPPPTLSVDDTAAIEGDALSQLAFRVRVWPRSLETVVVHYATVAGSATAGVDFAPTSGSLTFFPAALSQNVVVGVLGDRAIEGDETFSLVLSAPVGATLADGQATATLIDDDAAPLSSLEVAHGTTVRADLAGGQPDFYRIAQEPHSSYEAVLDEASGDASPGLVLARVATDNVTILQSAATVGVGGALTLRWRNDTASTMTGQHLRVGSPSCGPACGTDDTYRLRVRETTASIARFNTSGSQATVLILQNAAAASTTGAVSFWTESGELLGQHVFTLGARASLTLNAATVHGVSGRSGSITIAHNGSYGALAGKAVSLEPATGFSFDSPLTYRRR